MKEIWIEEIGDEIYDFIKSFEQKNIAEEVDIPKSNLCRLFAKNKSKNKIAFNKARLTMFYWFMRKQRDVINKLIENIEDYLYRRYFYNSL